MPSERRGSKGTCPSPIRDRFEKSLSGWTPYDSRVMFLSRGLSRRGIEDALTNERDGRPLWRAAVSEGCGRSISPFPGAIFPSKRSPDYMTKASQCRRQRWTPPSGTETGAVLAARHRKVRLGCWPVRGIMFVPSFMICAPGAGRNALRARPAPALSGPPHAKSRHQGLGRSVMPPPTRRRRAQSREERYCADYAVVAPSARLLWGRFRGVHRPSAPIDQPSARYANDACSSKSASAWRSSPTASAWSQCWMWCSERWSASPSDGADCVSPSSSFVGSPHSSSNSTKNTRPDGVARADSDQPVSYPQALK